MGNETFLFTTESSSKPQADFWSPDPRGPLLLAKNCIPLFWYMLYDLECLVPAEASGTIRYLALTNTTESALALARKRWPHLRPILGPEEDGLFASWSGFIERHAAAYLHCETWEWSWLFRSPREFRSHLRTCLSAFDHMPRLRGGRAVLNRWWRTLLGQCESIDREGRISPLGDFSYCGVCFGARSMSWSRDLRDA